MPLPSTNALPFAVSAIFAGAICANASELVQITAAAAMAANVLDIMTESLSLVGCSYASISNNNAGNSNLFPQAGEPNRRRCAKRDNAVNPDLDTRYPV